MVGSAVRYPRDPDKVVDVILTPDKLALLQTSSEVEPFDGDPHRFRLGIEAMRLQLAFEYDPYFSLSIARVDPLPHQLEAVYDYCLRLPRIRFLLADDPGAGKTIMAGLLIKELKMRGLIKRVLIITPASLCFQWQREMKDKFREQFDIVRSDILRANYGSNPWQEKNQVVTSVSWVSVVEDAKESLLRSRWDLIIVDEAHKMSAATRVRKTLAYQLGEQLSQMAMLQRRFASSIYAVRRSLERMKDKRERVLADPDGYRQQQIDKRLPDNFDDLPDEEQQEIIASLEDVVASVVLAKFAAGRGLKLTLGVEVKPDGGLSKQKFEETKAALRELRLNENLTPL